MPKKIEDIIPNERRSIRSIPIPARRAKETKMIEPKQMPEPIIVPRIEREVMDESPVRHLKSIGTGSSKKKLWIGLGGVVAVVLIFIILSLTGGATLTYVPKQSKLAFANEAYTAHQTATTGELPYSIIKLSGDKSVEVPATGEESVSVKASGRVVLYNEQSTSQSLVKTTRLESPDGKIFRIQDNVSIPAKGNLELTVVADQPGSDYNIALSDFTIPGFKGTPKSTSVYARSKTVMSGGFVGTRKKVSEADQAKAKVTLDDELKTELLSQARAQMPVDYVLFPNLSQVNFEALSQDAGSEGTASVSEKGNLNAVIFKRSDLAQYLGIQKLDANNLGSAVEIPDFSSLNITLAGNADVDLVRVAILKIQVSGTATLRYVTDENNLAADLMGLKKSDVTEVLKKYPSIESASAVVRPFWKSSFPTDAGKIKIVERI